MVHRSPSRRLAERVADISRSDPRNMGTGNQYGPRAGTCKAKPGNDRYASTYCTLPRGHKENDGSVLHMAHADEGPPHFGRKIAQWYEGSTEIDYLQRVV